MPRQGAGVGISGLYRDNGKEHGNYYSTIGYIGYKSGLYRDNGK